MRWLGFTGQIGGRHVTKTSKVARSATQFSLTVRASLHASPGSLFNRGFCCIAGMRTSRVLICRRRISEPSFRDRAACAFLSQCGYDQTSETGCRFAKRCFGCLRHRRWSYRQATPSCRRATSCAVAVTAGRLARCSVVSWRSRGSRVT